MNENELARALLQYGALEPANAPPDPRVLTQKILEHDRRNVRAFAMLMLMFWVLALGASGFFMEELIGRFSEVGLLVDHFGLKRLTLFDNNEALVVAACATLTFLLLA